MNRYDYTAEKYKLALIAGRGVEPLRLGACSVSSFHLMAMITPNQGLNEDALEWPLPKVGSEGRQWNGHSDDDPEGQIFGVC